VTFIAFLPFGLSLVMAVLAGFLAALFFFEAFKPPVRDGKFSGKGA
jgi:hypothetical protein